MDRARSQRFGEGRIATPSGATSSRRTFQHISGHQLSTYQPPTGSHSEILSVESKFEGEDLFLRMHRGRVRDTDDRALDCLQSSDGLSPRLGMRVVQQREALLLQLVRCDLDGVGVRDLELDAGL